MIIDGKAIAEDLYKGLSKRREMLNKKLKLGIIIGGVNPVIESFVRIKTRAAERLNVEMVRIDLPAGADTATAIEAIEELAKRTDAIIVQLPLPKEIDTHISLAAIPKEKDVDAINPTIPDNEHPVFAPVALAVVEILRRTGVNPRAKRTVVVGAGRLVGSPSAVLLKRLGANVSLFTLEEGAIEDLKDADIVVLGVGKPGYIKPQHIKTGVALVDAGTTEISGILQGDADPSCAEKAHVFTPVPGGVGPIAVAMIFKNLFDLVEKK
ncbi:hypothetical protein A3C86_03820 [Candidatus Kaiserbacteria bacterium RIFCSPHIGHO2_02_FULL_49_16]|uniref:Methenyltetrahydrofolate cyclohydrolase n=1 Tax=Candidatus Kaiserbacteria bacterium RIFCSPHIGHO2_02_FULL_49_16 TaxID=1798490 RepID=A0A1F6D9W6_9BACT|nr:MAG: hypothetical protein A3C86_03820 [Candidatus Kaiserbacteria bacterium RIFCSPHIGHO2_02_FULL_49_16]